MVYERHRSQVLRRADVCLELSQERFALLEEQVPLPQGKAVIGGQM